MKQTVTWLLGGQMTEELLHASDSGKSGRSGDDLIKQYLPVSYPSLVQTVCLSSSQPLHARSEDLIGRHADDIFTPPPNC